MFAHGFYKFLTSNNISKRYCLTGYSDDIGAEEVKDTKVEEKVLNDELQKIRNLRSEDSEGEEEEHPAEVEETEVENESEESAEIVEQEPENSEESAETVEKESESVEE